ncbi:hypothetical protein [Clostridium sp. BNL1100]|uniref:hypothetical protein n=1 Tax=Clostridium sp. BNL1100 TaxID=755731 RepID=UPI00024A71BC|nr:hypothetical protein [Clostridium sp. BNL1100]AEY67204.1 hypothetical protein Clo1100_3056 [Clostridium sp. BNL1100]
MKIIIILIKNYFLQFTKYNELKYGNSTNRKRLLFQYFIIGIAVTVLLGYWTYTIRSILGEFNKADYVLGYVLIPLMLFVSVMTFLSSALKGTGILYLEDNLETYFSMPIKTYKIVISKLIVIYLYIEVISLILLLPPSIYYCMVKEGSMALYFLEFLSILILPVLPINIGVLFGLLLQKAGKRARIAKNKYSPILRIVFLFLCICMIILVSIKSEFAGQIVKQIQSELFKVSYNIIVNTSSKNILMFNLFISLLGLLSFYVINISYKKQYYLLRKNINSSIAWNINNLKKQNYLHALVKRERRRYFSIPVYVINTMLGIVAVAVYVIAAIVSRNNILNIFQQIGQYYKLGNSVGVLNVSVITILIALTNVCYSSISIEGKNHQIVKSYPIRGFDFFGAKILFHLSLTVPTILIANTVLVIVLKISTKEVLLGFLLPILFTYFLALLGSTVNIFFPDFQWKNVTYIVKQSFSAILSVFAGIGFVSCSIFILFKYFSSNLLDSFFVLTLVMFLVDIIFSICFFKNSDKFFKRI